jgi:hypothetical protein
VANSEADPESSKVPKEMAWFDPPELQAGDVEDLGIAPAYAIGGAAAPYLGTEVFSSSSARLHGDFEQALTCR